MAPQHSALVLHGAPPPVQQRKVPRSVAQCRPAQHAVSLVQTVVLPGARQVVVGARQAPPVQVRPGQQSLPSQGMPVVWHTHQRPVAVPDAAQAMRPQQVFTPTPASVTRASAAPPSPTPASPVVVAPHAVPTGVQQRRAPAVVDEHESPEQQSELRVQPVAPKARQVGVVGVMRAQRPAVQVVPAQHSVSSTQAAPSAWHTQRRVVGSQSALPQQSRELAHDPPMRWQHRVCTGVGLHS